MGVGVTDGIKVFNTYRSSSQWSEPNITDGDYRSALFPPTWLNQKAHGGWRSPNFHLLCFKCSIFRLGRQMARTKTTREKTLKELRFVTLLRRIYRMFSDRPCARSSPLGHPTLTPMGHGQPSNANANAFLRWLDAQVTRKTVVPYGEIYLGQRIKVMRIRRLLLNKLQVILNHQSKMGFRAALSEFEV